MTFLLGSLVLLYNNDPGCHIVGGSCLVAQGHLCSAPEVNWHLSIMWCCVCLFLHEKLYFTLCNRTKTSKRCDSLPFRLISSMDTWWTGSWSRRTQPVPVQNCEVSWRGWNESPSGCLLAGCGPKLNPPASLQKNFTVNPPKSRTSPLLMSWSTPPTKGLLASLGVCWTSSMWLKQGCSATSWGAKRRGWCQKNTSLSEVSQQIDSCLGPQLFHRQKKKRKKKTVLLSLSRVIFIQVWF